MLLFGKCYSLIWSDQKWSHSILSKRGKDKIQVNKKGKILRTQKCRTLSYQNRMFAKSRLSDRIQYESLSNLWRHKVEKAGRFLDLCDVTQSKYDDFWCANTFFNSSHFWVGRFAVVGPIWYLSHFWKSHITFVTFLDRLKLHWPLSIHTVFRVLYARL